MLIDAHAHLDHYGDELETALGEIKQYRIFTIGNSMDLPSYRRNLEIGEMCLSLIGLSAVTQLSVARVVGLMMGAFWLATAYSEVLAAQFGKLAALDLPADGVIDMAEAGATYGGLFELMLWVGVGSGLVFALASPLVKRWMHGVK